MRILIDIFMCAAFLPACTTLEASLPTKNGVEIVAPRTTRSDGLRDASGPLEPQGIYSSVGAIWTVSSLSPNRPTLKAISAHSPYYTSIRSY